jgi:nucleotide-binding universal stress UspA family protein
MLQIDATPSRLRRARRREGGQGKAAMTTYASILVGLDAEPTASARVKLAANLAARFDARLIAAGARTPVIRTLGETISYSRVIAEYDARQAKEDFDAVNEVFRCAVGDNRRAEIRSGMGLPAPFIVSQAGAGDLIVLGRQGRGDSRDWRFGVDPADVIMQAGRPVLVTPPGTDHLSAQRIVLASTSSREARRAIFDAMPLLERAKEIVIVAIGAAHSDKVDVKDYLAAHGIEAEITPDRPRCEETIADEIIALAVQVNADLIVSGAYGHSRTREWILGGVTHDLLDHAPMCCLMSH